MTLAPGSRLGVYEITVQIGEGGMGQVYRAFDTKLKRHVAIKILPPSLAADADRLARFQREAEVLASLNHPQIAGIYGLEESSGVAALVMELVEGEDLSTRIARLRAPGASAGQAGMSLDEALPIAKQIADALEAAHELNIVHRDLKPANIKIRPDGTVKLLDFGLAKALDQGSGGGGAGSGNASMSPTLSLHATQAGMILGTAAYMAPEQARGKVVDKRADIWAFGAVLFEMLTGTRAFPGEDLTDTLAAVVKLDPAWDALTADVPPRVRQALRVCLQKDPKRRAQAIGDVRLALEGAFETTAPPAMAAATPAGLRRRTILMASLTFLVAAVAVLATWLLTRPSPVSLQPVRFEFAPTGAQALEVQGSDRDLVMSPDGRYFVYVAGSEAQLMVRAIDALDAVPLRGIVGARSPFISPDSRWIGFFTRQGEMQKVAIAGGPPVPLCPNLGTTRGASWGPDETIIFATNALDTGLFRVAGACGTPTKLTFPDSAHGEEDHLFPSFLPNGRAVLFTITSSSSGIEAAQVAVLDLTTGQHSTLIPGGSQAEYVEPGYLVYGVGGTLRAVRFDPVRLALLGDPVLAVEQVTTLRTGAAEFSTSRTGALVYVPGAVAERSLVWVTRQGHEEPLAGAEPRAYQYPRLSPDGTRIALDIRDGQDDIWIWDLARKTMIRLTDSPAPDQHPVWTPDSQRVIFSSRRAGAFNLFSQAANKTGTVDRLTTSPNTQFPYSISLDGRWLTVRDNVPGAGSDLGVVRLGGAAPLGGGPSTASMTSSSAPAPSASGAPGIPQLQPEPLVKTKFAEDNGEISLDGRWLAYQSNESGPDQIYVRPFPNVEVGHWTIGRGSRPLWAKSGTELFYLDEIGALMSVPIQTAPTFSAGTPVKLFDGQYYAGGYGRPYDVSADGQRFLMIKGTGPAPSMIVVVNWLEDLKARLPPK